MLDYLARLKAARSRMAERGIGLMYLTPGANLFYLTGIGRQEGHRTEQNAYGDWAVGGYIGLEEGIVLVVPRMGGSYFEDEAQGKSWISSVRTVLETEDPLEVMREVLGQLRLRDRRVAVDNRAWAQTVQALLRLLPDADLVLASEVIAPMRMIKDEEELNLMRKAGEITDVVFTRSLAHLKAGVTEIDVASEIDYQFKLAGAEFTSFATGIQFKAPGRSRGSSTARVTNRQLLPGDSITFDFGCVYQGYCSDFGRSAFVGEPTADYLKIHETVLRAQRAGMDAMKAGQITASQVNAIARSVIEAEGYGPCFTHRLGHGIGVTCHEPPFLDLVDPTLLQANMTFTVEPSIRVPDGFGNRVEDVVCVTETGGVSLYATDRRIYLIE